MFKRILLLILVMVIGLILILPLVIPIPPLANAQPVEALADADSRFFDLNGIRVHYKQAGEGGPLIVLLHGFLGSTDNWSELLEPLANYGTVVAFDRPGFGLTERPDRADWNGVNPYAPESQVALVQALMQELGYEQAVLVGHSAGGPIAMQMALEAPEMVQGLVLVAPAVYNGGGTPGWIRPLLSSPQARRLGPYLLRNSLGGQAESLLKLAYHDPGRFTPAEIARNSRYTQIDGWDSALWEFTLASRQLGLASRLDQLTLPTLVVAGDDDRIVPTADSVRLAEELPNAELTVIPACGHLPQTECPEPTIAAVDAFLANLLK